MTPPFSRREAADFYAEMLDDALVETARIARTLQLCPILSVDPGEACGAFADRIAGLDGDVATQFQVVPQRGRDLAERMEWGVAEAAAGGARRILLRGSDCPILDDKAVAEALAALDDCDIALAPDSDGGYGLIGLRAPAPELFRQEMSTPEVARETLARARGLGLRARVLAPSFDIDTVEDLARLAEAREHGLTRACPRTLAFLDARRLWPTRRGVE
jgi:glycosyltransferase A (GT-A) superfamily protein (DUF2064 family)